MKRVFFFFSSKENLWFWILFLPSLFLLALGKFLKISFFSLFLSYLILGLFLTLISWRLFFKEKEALFKKHLWKEIVEFLVDPVIVYDKDFTLIGFNKSAERFFSLKKEEVLGKKISPQKIKDERWQFLAQIVFPSLAPAIKIEKKFKDFEVFRLVFEKPWRELRIYFGKIFDKKGKPICFVKVIKDISREKFLLKEKSEFLNIAAHNLNTPVSEIRWGLESLEKMISDSIPQEAKELLLRLKSISANLGEIIDDLLSAARIEEGRFGYQFEKVELNQLIKESKEKWEKIAARYQVKLFFEPKQKEIFVFCDPIKIRIVLDNLIENALIYNVKNGEIYIRSEILEDKPFALVSVKDTGIGIPEDEQSKIFEKFFRARNAVKYQAEGIGLGLYITKNIIERHGGKIWFESIEDRGTTFYFTLPLKKELIPPKELPVI